MSRFWQKIPSSFAAGISRIARKFKPRLDPTRVLTRLVVILPVIGILTLLVVRFQCPLLGMFNAFAGSGTNKGYEPLLQDGCTCSRYSLCPCSGWSDWGTWIDCSYPRCKQPYPGCQGCCFAYQCPPTNPPPPTNTPVPPPTDTPVPPPTDTPVPPSTDTPVPLPTDTPVTPATDTPAPLETDTPAPPPTDTQAPGATNTSIPSDPPVPPATRTPSRTKPPAPVATNTPSATRALLPGNAAGPTATETPGPTGTSPAGVGWTPPPAAPQPSSASADLLAAPASATATRGEDQPGPAEPLLDLESGYPEGEAAPAPGAAPIDSLLPSLALLGTGLSLAAVGTYLDKKLEVASTPAPAASTISVPVYAERTVLRPRIVEEKKPRLVEIRTKVVETIVHSEVVTKTVQVAQTVWNWVTEKVPLLGWLGNAIGWVLNTVLKPVTTWVTKVVTSVVTWVEEKVTWVTNTVQDGWDIIKKTVWEPVKERVQIGTREIPNPAPPPAPTGSHGVKTPSSPDDLSIPPSLRAELEEAWRQGRLLQVVIQKYGAGILAKTLRYGGVLLSVGALIAMANGCRPQNALCAFNKNACPTSTFTLTSTPTRTKTPTRTSTRTPTRTKTGTPTRTRTWTPTRSNTPTNTTNWAPECDTLSAGEAFTCHWERPMYKLYDDGGEGSGHCTIGIGRLVHYGPCVCSNPKEAPYREADCTKREFNWATVVSWFRSDRKTIINQVNGLVTVPLNQCQFDALVDLQFNTGGIGASDFSTGLGYLRARQYSLVPTEISNFRAGGGLAGRRDAEAALFSSCPYP